MEQLRLILGQDKEFDQIVHGARPQASGITIATKDAGTESGMPVAVISFDAEIDGKRVRVQATTTLRLLVGFYSACKGRYGPGGPQGYAVTEYRIAKEVLATFRRADPARPLRDRKLFNSCRETLREGGALIIWPEKNKVNFTEGQP